MVKKPNKLKVIPLGGIREIGKNMTVVEYKDSLIVVDCGMTFPDDDMPGVDIVIPDMSYLLKNRNKIKGIVLTHGHEDHIGAIPYLLKQLKVPIYGTKLTLGLLENKLREHRLDRSVLKAVHAGQTVKLGCLSVEFVRASHSIPDSCSLAIKTPVGILFFTGDFKIDYTPIDGDCMDLNRIAALGDEGVLALFADSTNVERPGYTMSERVVEETFKNVFLQAEARIIVATFASNLHRVQQIIQAAEHYGRKVAVSGRSMVNNIKVAMDLGYLKMKKNTMIDINDIGKYPAKNILLLTTGSQGEPMSAMARMANSDHRKVKLNPTDTVVISASPIPGNEKTVFNVINKLTELGVKVIYQSLADVHVSGHACQEELKLIHNLIKPRFFVPVHGEFRHLTVHKKLALSMGMSDKDVLVCSNGNTIEFTRNSMKLVNTDHAANVLVDGLGVGDVGSVVLTDRKMLSENGLIIVIMPVSRRNKRFVGRPEIISRGFIYVKENLDLIEEARKVVTKTIKEEERKKKKDWTTIKSNVRDNLRSFIFKEMKRSPMILPVIVEI